MYSEEAARASFCWFDVDRVPRDPETTACSIWLGSRVPPTDETRRLPQERRRLRLPFPE